MSGKDGSTSAGKPKRGQLIAVSALVLLLGTGIGGVLIWSFWNSSDQTQSNANIPAAPSPAISSSANTFSDTPRAEIDPMIAEVPSRPDLVDPLSESEYATRYADALRLAGPVPDAATVPTGGARITAVDPDSPGAAASLSVNDVIVAIDGKPTPTSDAAIASHSRATAAQTLEIIPADGQAHRFVKVDRGRLGIQLEDAWLLEGLYLHNLPGGELPVDEVRVAARCAEGDPELAESALAHAKIIGGPGTQGPAVDAIAAVALS